MVVMDQHRYEIKHSTDARQSHQGQNTKIVLESQMIHACSYTHTITSTFEKQEYHTV